jgi:hypothetical protein
MDPPGGMHPYTTQKCSLVIPPSELAEICLKLISIAYCEMGQKGFPGSNLMIAQEPRMCPPKVSHSQCLKNASLMISPS